MYPLTADRVYVMNRVYDNPAAVTRLNRMLDVIHPQEIVKLSDKNLWNLVSTNNWTHGHHQRTGAYHRTGSPTLIFNTFRWGKWDVALKKFRYPSLNRALFLGQDSITHRGAINHMERNICQAAWEVHSIYGCLHACDYCHVEDFVNIMLDIEALIAHLKQIMPTLPQRLYKYDNYSDIPVFEPEYDACRPMVDFFSTLDRQFLLLYTKSDNIDYLLDLDHKGHTIMNWSLSPPTQSTLIEKNTPSMDRRIRAMEKCEKAGYPVRVRFSPLIPVKNWQEEISTMIEQYLSRVHPDVITIDIIGFMSSQQMLEIMDSSLLDERAKQILQDQAQTHRLYGKHTFPDTYREEIYRHVLGEIRRIDPKVLVALCNETPKMWKTFESYLSPNCPSSYYCCCGPDSVPPSISRY
jgi:DNA repair photolyase